jgi:hypothetical protein
MLLGLAASDMHSTVSFVMFSVIRRVMTGPALSSAV